MPIKQYSRKNNKARRATLLIIALFMVLPLNAMAEPFDEFPYDLRLVRELTEIGMTDYAMRQVQNMYARYPDRRDQVDFAQARVYLASGQRNRALEILRQIPEQSPLFAESRMLLGQNAFRRRDYEEARKAFEDYFRIQPTPASRRRQDVLDFIEAIQLYAQVFIQLGQPKQVEEALDLLEVIGDAANIGPAEISYFKANAALAAYELLREQGKDINQDHIQQIIQDLEAVQFATDYMVIINATIESARAHLLLDKHLEAIRKVRSLDELLGMVAEQVPSRESPVAPALFYEGKALRGLAENALKGGDRQQARRLFTASARRFKKVMDEFARHRVYDKSLIEFGMLRTVMEDEFDVTLPGPAVSGDLLAKLNQADRLFESAQYKDAIPLYLDAFRIGRTHERAPEIGLRLIISFLQTSDLLRARALCSYLEEAFPDNEETGKAFLQLGNAYYRDAQNISEDEERREELLDKAMEVWDTFVGLTPNHPQAADIAFVIAENQYRKASNTAAEARRTAALDESEKLKQQARELYQNAIPDYERVIENFGRSSRAVRSYYKLGWVYHALDMETEAAEAFLRYYALEINPDNAKDRMLAKFHAAHQMMSSDNPLAAIEHFQEFIKTVNDEQITGLDIQAQDIQKMAVDAENYLAWSYDQAAEELRPQRQNIDDDISEWQAAISEWNEELESYQLQQEEGEEMKAEAAELFQEQQKVLTALPANPEEQAREQLSDQLEEAQSDEERALVRERMGREAERNRNRIIDILTGERRELESQRSLILEQYREIREELQDISENIDQTREKLEQAEMQYYETRDQLAGRQEEITSVEKRIEQLSEKNTEWQDKFREAREAFEDGDEQAREEAQQIGQEARRQIREIRGNLIAAREELRKLTTDERIKQIDNLKTNQEELEAQVESLTSKLAELQDEELLAKQKSATYQAHQKAIAGQINRLETEIEMVKLSESERQKQLENEAWSEQVQKAVNAFDEYRQALISKGKLLQKTAEDNISQAKQNIADARKQIARLQNLRQPLVEEFRELKNQAQQQFMAFNEEYPQSEHVPGNLARLGTNYMEMDDYDTARIYLSELAERFPEAKALERALFSLAKAQMETGQVEEAVEIFEELLADRERQGLGTLSYILREMLEEGYPQLAVRAGEELLRRSEDPNHENHDALAGKTQENLFFRLGKAAFAAAVYQDAIQYLEKLLELNEQTAHFFDAKMMLGQAKRRISPQDLTGSRDDLLDVMQFAQDQMLQNEATLAIARTYIDMEVEREVRRALGQISTLVQVSEGEVLVFLDEQDESALLLLEEAIFIAAKCHALLGNENARDLLVEYYEQKFPGNRFNEELSNLPDARY